MKHKIILLLPFSLLFINACCSLDRIGNLIYPKTKEEMKELFFQEIISPQLTANICYLNYSTNNFYYPTMLDYIEEFESNNEIIFSYLMPYRPKNIFIAVTAIKDKNQYDLIITESKNKKIWGKGIKILTEEEFSVLLDSINIISNEMKNILGIKINNLADVKLLGVDSLENKFEALLINPTSKYITFFPADTRNLSDKLAERYGKFHWGIWDLLIDETSYKWLLK